MTDHKPATLTLPSDTEIAMERVFDAPREMVFKACTNPEAIAYWWGPRKYKTVVDVLEAHTGGAWRFLNIAADGEEHAFRGEFREITPPERISYTFEYEGMPGYITLETISFEEIEDGRTRMSVLMTFDSKEGRDGMLESGMDGGANESWDKLDEYLAKELQKA